MPNSYINNWLSRLGYLDAKRDLHTHGSKKLGTHPYGSEIEDLVNPDGLIKAKAVYDIDNVPTICFLDDDGLLEDEDRLKRIREKIWNQNLITIFLVLSENKASCIPVSNVEYEENFLNYNEASDNGDFSKRDIDSGGIFKRRPEWFTTNEKVDRKLLENLSTVISKLQSYKIVKNDAQYLMAQVLFVSYLQHREIIGKTYREKYELGLLDGLVLTKDVEGIVRLLTQLKKDLNGDFLEPENSGSNLWLKLPTEALDIISMFLQRVDLESGQSDIWHYDFKYIPVELISGIYESFLSEEKQQFGAYYTPRNLANFVVDHAFSKSKNILEEKIYDGACGSGILLTTAFRRMLAFAKSKKNSALSFKERAEILCNSIFGSDINLSACRVTSFSLYLSLLEGLTPRDIVELQENENVKLPPLSSGNIVGGKREGDFFSSENKLSTGKKFTLILSNPPWVEPRGSDVTTSDQWVQSNKYVVPRRQMAGAFMLKARECLIDGGRFCLILPASIIAAKTSSKFLKQWFEQNELATLINFGDLRKLLFNNAKQPCMIALGSPRTNSPNEQISFDEHFDYFVPKADVSFAFGRLTIHSNDRHKVNTRLACYNNELFTTLYWGTAKDLSNIAELRVGKTLGDYIGKDNKLDSRKGFHKKDSAVKKPAPSTPLKSLKYLDARSFKGNHPILPNSVLTKFPDSIKTVAKLSSSLMDVFAQPKIVFTDGITANRTVRASFSDKPFSFSSSIGVISGTKEDSEVMRFISVFLHSKLVQYVLMLTAYQIVFERERVTLSDIKKLPFVHPEDHKDPELAWKIIKSVNERVKGGSGHTGNELLNLNLDDLNFDGEIYQYFGIGKALINRINEVSCYVAENIQPSSIASLGTPPPNNSMLDGYADSLMSELEIWRDLRNGNGCFKLKITINSNTVRGPVGVVCIEPSDSRIIEKTVDDVRVDTLIEAVLKTNVSNISLHPNLNFIADIVLTTAEQLYLIKPLVSRFWLKSESYMDAQRLVQTILKSQEARL